VVLLFPAVSRVREAAAKAQDANNLKLISLGLINFSDVHGSRLPAATAYRGADGRPLLSWRVAILPYIEHGSLYNQFKLDEPWDSPHNRQFLGRMPATYARGGEQPTAEGLTHYQVFVGKGALFEERPENLNPNPGGGIGPPGMGGPGPGGIGMGGPGGMLPRFSARFPMDISDGTSNTIMIAEAKNAVPWTKPEDLPFDPDGPLPLLGGRFSGGLNVATADGAVRFLRFSNPEASIRAAITRAGGEVVSLDW
jgi:hypothetical protein